MARIAGVDIPQDKRIEIALTYIRGIGKTASRSILLEAGVNSDTRAKDLTEKEVTKIRLIVEKKYRVEGELGRTVALNIKRLKEIGCYRGTRHIKGLPVRGQRTKTNARTKKGRRSIIGGIKGKRS